MNDQQRAAMQMALEAGLPTSIDGMTIVPLIERFAALVAEATKEKAANVIENECHDDMTRAEEAAAIRSMK